MKVIYEDNHILAVNKPAGQLAQGDWTGRSTLLDEAKAWLKRKYGKPGNVFLGLTHRLDRRTSGVIVLAKTSKAASRLSEEIRARRTLKIYWAKTEGKIPGKGAWTDRLKRGERRSRIVSAPEGKEVRLSFVRLRFEHGVSLTEIILETGRKHQIRAQFSHRGFPILGDRLYGARQGFGRDAIALHAREMRVRHPTLRTEARFVAELGELWKERNNRPRLLKNDIAHSKASNKNKIP